MTLHVESVGAGAPLVLLHGWALHGGIFAPLLPELSMRYRVHVIDLPGHGHSAPLLPYTLDSVTDALMQAIDGIDGADAPLAILGWSFGGMLAQRLAARFPSRVAQLVLVCTTPRFANGDGWAHGVAPRVLQQFADELRVAQDATLRRFLALQMLNVPHARATLARMRVLLDARPRANAAAIDGALAILATADLRGAAATLAAPALVVSGGRDALAPAAAGAWLAAAMPDATLATIAEAAHVPFLSHPVEFSAALARFADAVTG